MNRGKRYTVKDLATEFHDTNDRESGDETDSGRRVGVKTPKN